MNHIGISIAHVPIAESEIKAMINSGDDCLMLWDANGMIIDWSIAAPDFFGAVSKESLHKNINNLSPRYQPDGQLSESAIREWIKHAFEHGTASFDWLCKKLDGRHVDCRVDMYAGEYRGQKIVCTFMLDRFAENHKYNDPKSVAQEKLQYLIDSSPMVCAVFDEDANVQEVSQSVTDVFEISDKSVFIERSSDFNPEFQPDGTPSRLQLAQIIKQAMDTGYAHMEWMHQKLDGTPIPCKVYIRYAQFGDRNVFISYTQDLREHKEMMARLEAAREREMEQALIRSGLEKEREIHEMVQMLLDSAPFTVDIWDDNYNIVSTNRRSPETLYGASGQEEFVREFFRFSPEYQPCGTLTQEKAKKYFDLARQTGNVRLEWLHQTTSGELIPAEITVVHRVHGGKTMLLAYTTDLRPLREADAKIREAEELNLLFLNKAPFAINWVDEKFQFIDCNTHTLKMFGFTDKEEYRNNIPKLHPEFQPCGTHSTEKIVSLLNMTMKKGYARHEWMYKHSNGEPIPAENLFVKLERNNKTMIVNYTIDLREVKEAEALARKLLDNSPLFMEFWDTDGNMFDCNTKMLETFGVSGVAELSERFYEFCDPVQPCGTPPEEMHAQMTQRAMREGICRAECTHVLPNGERMPTEATWTYITHQDKPMIIVYSQDLRPVKEAMERERELMERWTAIHEASPIGINFWDKDMNLLGGNKAGYELSGFTHKEEAAKTMLAIAPERQPDGTLSSEKIAKAFETAFTEGDYRFEWMHNTPDGKPLPMDATLKRVEHQDDYMMVVYLQDLRLLREADEKLHEAEKLNQLIIDASPMFMEAWDDNGVLVRVSERVVEFFDLSYKEEFIERYSELSPKYQPCGTLTMEKAAAIIAEVKRKGSLRFEWMHLHPGTGEHIPVECFFVKLELRNKIMILGYSYDLRPIRASMEKARELEIKLHQQEIEERSRIKIAEESSLAKSRFLAHMSHEMRTPMNAIIGMSEIAKNTNDPEKKDYCLSRVEQASRHLLSVINNVLDMSKIEAGKLELNIHPFDIRKVLGNVVDMLDLSLKQKRHHLTVDVDISMPRIIVGDDLRLTQITLNLLSNAVKFTPEDGSISIKATHDKNMAESFMRVEVADTGIGVPQDQQAKIFNAFEQVEAGIDRRYTGTGLGLAITKQIINIAGGNIWMESEVGKGSNFVFTWPFIPADEDTEASATKNSGYENNCFNGHTILVAEDVDINREILETLLQDTGLLIDFAENGNAAVEKISANPGRYSLILMDIQMPGMDGYSATKAIRNLNTADAAALPIIAMTANTFREDIERCLEAGMDSHLGKPIDSEKLYAMLGRYLK